MSEQPKCQICGEPMPPGEEMFKYHGYSGDCPKPPLPRPPTELEQLKSENAELRAALEWYAAEADAIARHVLAQRTNAVMASMQVLALDAGKRAREAMQPNAEVSGAGTASAGLPG